MDPSRTLLQVKMDAAAADRPSSVPDAEARREFGPAERKGH